jgi:hypothetical protein
LAAGTASAADEKSADSFRRHAVLIGCTKYRHLKGLDLDGPANDVALLRGLIVDRFGFQPVDIVEMTERSPAELRPDRQNIVRVMGELAARVGKDDEVFLLFAGHGSRLPDEAEPDGVQPTGGKPEGEDFEPDFEPDGLDEVFLPADVTEWKENEKVVLGITDDEIHGWLQALRRRGAFVFFVADTCHSGTLSRNPETDDDRKVKTRHVPDDVLTPPEKLSKAVEKAAKRSANETSPGIWPLDLGTTGRDGPARAEGADADNQAGGLVAFAAVPSGHAEPEHRMPPNERFADPIYGRLSYAIHHVLTKATTRLTYRELARHVAWQYQSWGWTELGGIEGIGFDREVLGKRVWKDRSTLLLTRADDGSLRVGQGLAHGITRGTILKVLAPIGAAGATANLSTAMDADRVLGYVTVTGVSPVTATVEPIAYGGMPRVEPRQLPDKTRCLVEVVDYGQLQVSLRVRAFSADELKDLAEAGVPLSPADPTIVGEIERVVAGLTGASPSLIRQASEGDASDGSPDLYLLVAGDGAYLYRRGEALTSTAALPRTFRTYVPGNDLAARLDRDLRFVAQGINLQRLAGDEELQAVADRAVSLKVRFSRARSSDGAFTPVLDETAATFTDGDYLRLELTNDGRIAADVTVLYLDAAFQIQSHFPTLRQAVAGANNTLDVGQSHPVTIKLNDSTVGLEHLLILAVARDPASPPVNFAFLSQAGLSRSGYERTRGGKPHPLDELLAAGLYEGSRGRRSVDAARTYSIRRYPVRIVKRPGGP